MSLTMAASPSRAHTVLTRRKSDSSVLQPRSTPRLGPVNVNIQATTLEAYARILLDTKDGQCIGGLKLLLSRLRSAAADACGGADCQIYLRLKPADGGEGELLWFSGDELMRMALPSDDAGLAGAVACAGQPVVVGPADPRWRRAVDGAHSGGSSLFLPIFGVEPTPAWSPHPEAAPAVGASDPGERTAARAAGPVVGVLAIGRALGSAFASAFGAADVVRPFSQVRVTHPPLTDCRPPWQAVARGLAALASVAFVSLQSAEAHRRGAARLRSTERLASMLAAGPVALPPFLAEVQTAGRELAACQSVTVYLTDASGALHAPAGGVDGTSGARHPPGVTSLLASAAAGGRIVRVADARRDPRFHAATDEPPGSAPAVATLLVPVRGPVVNGRFTGGVIQAVNKCDGAAGGFGPEDAAALSVLADLTAAALAAHAHTAVGEGVSAGHGSVVAIAGRSTSPRLEGESGPSGGTAIVVPAPWHLWRVAPGLTPAVPRATDGLVDCLGGLLRGGPPGGGGAGDDAPPYLRWDFDVFNYNRDQLASLVVDVFAHHGLPQAFSIPRRTLERFAAAVAARYHDNPYHNFHHVFHVMQVASMLVASVPDVNRYLSRLDVLALLVAAICHDLDHPGLTNAFQINSMSPLALRYNDESVLEHHHASTLFHILRDDGSNILANLERTEFFAVRKLVCASILGTDMAAHFRLMSGFASHVGQPWDRKSLSDRQLLLTLLLHAADLSNATQEFVHARKWAEALGREFHNQTVLERKLGLPVLPFMEGGFAPSKEINFIQTFAGPLWSALAQLFPPLKPLADNVQVTLQLYAAIGQGGDKPRHP